MKKDSKYSAVIFDLDGLILDTEAIAHACWERAMAECGYVLEDEVYQKITGLTIADIKVVLRDIFGPEFAVEEIFERTYQYYDEHINKCGIAVKRGVAEMLCFLDKAELPKVVATSSAREFAIRKLRVCNLAERFDFVVGGDQVKNGKPAPDIFLEAADKLGVAAERCLVFEDSDNGVRAAHSAGMATIMIPDLKQPSKEIVGMVYRIFPSLYEAIPFLESVIGTRP
jgi:HAD superfamily hydrolase (TIGR01509 family)